MDWVTNRCFGECGLWVGQGVCNEQDRSIPNALINIHIDVAEIRPKVDTIGSHHFVQIHTGAGRRPSEGCWAWNAHHTLLVIARC